jgi:hypothetical protein
MLAKARSLLRGARTAIAIMPASSEYKTLALPPKPGPRQPMSCDGHAGGLSTPRVLRLCTASEENTLARAKAFRSIPVLSASCAAVLPLCLLLMQQA